MELNAFKISVCPLREKLLAQARRLTGNEEDAEDIVQEVLLRLWSKRMELDSCASIEAFATTVTRNACIDWMRTRHTSDSDLSEGTLQSDGQTPESLLEAKDEMQLVERIIRSLPPLQQAILRMKDVEGYETEEIAQVTGCNAEAIRSNLSRARKRMRDIYLKTIEERRKKHG